MNSATDFALQNQYHVVSCLDCPARRTWTPLWSLVSWSATTSNCRQDSSLSIIAVFLTSEISLGISLSNPGVMVSTFHVPFRKSNLSIFLLIAGVILTGCCSAFGLSLNTQTNAVGDGAPPYWPRVAQLEVGGRCTVRLWWLLIFYLATMSNKPLIHSDSSTLLEYPTSCWPILFSL